MVIDQTSVRALIMKYGKYVCKDGRKNVCKVRCQVCGKDIMSNEPNDVEIDAVLGKRGNLNAWHRSCKADMVWQSRIK